MKQMHVMRSLRHGVPAICSLAAISFCLVFVSSTASAATLKAAVAPLNTSDMDTAMGAAVHADDAQSVTLPNGNILWVYGDTTQVNGTSTSGIYGYPHDSFVLQKPGTATFTPVAGSYGYGWQQVPNWSDGTYFWMSSPVVDNGVLYVLGQRIQGVSPFTVVGNYVAVFNASTLAFQKIVAVPSDASGTAIWGGIAKDTGGWWVTGTHGVSCVYATDCKVGDIARVPFGSLATPSKWQVSSNVIPASTNIGTTLGLVKTNAGWDIFSKLGDAYGGTQIERLSAASVTGVWTVNGTWDAPSPAGTVTYAAAVHPEQAAPSGQVMASYAVNGDDADYHPLFLYLPL